MLELDEIVSIPVVILSVLGLSVTVMGEMTESVGVGVPLHTCHTITHMNTVTQTSRRAHTHTGIVAVLVMSQPRTVMISVTRNHTQSH